MATKFEMDEKVKIPAKINEILQNESVGIRYQVKIKANDKTTYLTVEEDEIEKVESSSTSTQDANIDTGTETHTYDEDGNEEL